MPSHLRECDGIPDRADDAGAAVLEVLVLGVGLLVPLLYGVLSVMAVQSASYAATSAAREASRAYVAADTPAQGLARAKVATRLVLADAGVTSSGPAVRCVGGCLVPGSRVDVTVRVVVPLPLLGDVELASAMVFDLGVYVVVVTVVVTVLSELGRLSLRARDGNGEETA